MHAHQGAVARNNCTHLPTYSSCSISRLESAGCAVNRVCVVPGAGARLPFRASARQQVRARHRTPAHQTASNMVTCIISSVDKLHDEARWMFHQMAVLRGVTPRPSAHEEARALAPPRYVNTSSMFQSMISRLAVRCMPRITLGFIAGLLWMWAWTPALASTAAV
jgi:hypothetical protein